jgi:glucose-6-phosphate 1-dehydrogenase
MSSAIGTFLLLGASGDLSGRLLLPALGQLLDAEPERRELMVIGSGAEDWSQDAWRERIRSSFAAGDVSEETTDAVLTRTRYERADVTAETDLKRLVAAGPPSPAVYFALPPAVAVAACTAMKALDLPDDTVLALEKPFGTDAASAASLNRLLADLVPENQIQRIDHFLGRATVLNLVGVRFANRLLEPLWNNTHIDSVDITYDEQLTLENRAGYYDRAGALTDMIQSHLLQVLALVAMEPPAAADAMELRDAKATVLRACHPWNGDPVAAGRRAIYSRGSIDGRAVPDYVAEPGVDPERHTETLAELVLGVDNWRWAGVPFRLRSGKALRSRRKEIVITFKPAPHLPRGLTGDLPPARLRLSMGPDQMALDLNVNGPDDPMELDRATLDANLSPGRLPAYGEVLAGLLDADPFLSVRGDTAEQCWRIVDPVLECWRRGAVPLDTYPAGSTGPDAWR